MTRLNRIISLLIILISILGLSAYAGSKKGLPQPKGEPYHPLTSYQKSLLVRIERTGVVAIKQGEQLKVVIPVDYYFTPQTTELRFNRVKSMKRIAAFVRSYASAFSRPVIRVSGYTDTVFSRKTRRRLSQEYANVVAAYLWDAGISKRNMRVKGYGARHSIASNRRTLGAAFNRRVEIQIN